MYDLSNSINYLSMKFLKPQKPQKYFSLLLILTFLVCSIGGMFCHMPASAGNINHSQIPFHHSSPVPAENCPDEITNSPEIGQKAFSSPMVNRNFHLMTVLFQGISQRLDFPPHPQDSSYPLLFLFYSVFLN